MADATGTCRGIDPDRACFTIALNTIQAAGVIADSGIGRLVLANLMPERRIRTTPHVVNRAISKYNAKGIVDRANYKVTLSIDTTTPAGP